jgi:hypothetical protein
MERTVARIISGGQTGVDRAALDFAIDHNILHGGWCPKGRRAEDGRIDDRYMLIETKSAKYEERTEKNILNADGTLILDTGTLSGGTALTADLCLKHLKPLHIIDLDEINETTRDEFWRWIGENAVRILNIAGSRESKHLIYERAKTCLEMLFNETSIH